MEGKCGDKHAAEEASREEDESACVAVDHPPSVAAIPKPFIGVNYAGVLLLLLMLSRRVFYRRFALFLQR